MAKALFQLYYDIIVVRNKLSTSLGNFPENTGSEGGKALRLAHQIARLSAGEIKEAEQ